MRESAKLHLRSRPQKRYVCANITAQYFPCTCKSNNDCCLDRYCVIYTSFLSPTDLIDFMFCPDRLFSQVSLPNTPGSTPLVRGSQSTATAVRKISPQALLLGKSPTTSQAQMLLRAQMVTTTPRLESYPVLYHYRCCSSLIFRLVVYNNSFLYPPPISEAWLLGSAAF